MEPTDRVNPYEAPRAELDAAPASGPQANLADAVAGRYSFTVGEVMDEAWRLVKGMKGTFWGAGIVVGLIFLAFNALCGVVLAAVVRTTNPIANFVLNGLVGALMTPLLM